MQFATKLVLALWAGFCVIYGVAAVERYRREALLFDGDMRRDHSVMGRGIAAAVGEIWASDGKERALAIVTGANEREAEVTIRWVEPDGSDPAHRPSAPPDQLVAVGEGRVTVWEDPGGQELVSYIPVKVGTGYRGAVEISEALERKEAYLRANLLRLGLTSLSLALLTGLITVGLGMRFVGRPIRRLVEKARQVGAGDFSHPLDLAQRDELGQLATEMNAMSDRLAEARRRVDAEAAARAAADEQLRHGERLMTVGTLAAGVAHELGTPLNVIAQRARMIAAGEVVGAEAAAYARIVADQSERITNIVRQLLDFSRPRRRDPLPVDLAEEAERALRLLDQAVRRAGVRVELLHGDPPARAHADPVQLQQVLTNILLNAVQAMPGGGRLRVWTGEVEAAPPGAPPGEASRWARVTVEDEGEGIAAADLPKVFDPFFTTKPVGSGSGLGLSVAYGIVREHGGWIQAASAPGAGARFEVSLPPAGAP